MPIFSGCIPVLIGPLGNLADKRILQIRRTDRYDQMRLRPRCRDIDQTTTILIIEKGASGIDWVKQNDLSFATLSAMHCTYMNFLFSVPREHGPE